ncbi:hypothetical protein [Brevibacterium pigmentatum]|uniref:hypothetical protein n=1 Tax=Brevibacterium pigmentatum TaxID=1496080 RepID=UPI001420ADDD|nr:hypothetical protein [Brevibacterium pigmentatum]
MSIDYRKIPTSVGDVIKSSNQFTIASKNPSPEDEPVARLATWSNVFANGGTVNLEVNIDGTRVDLAGVKVDDNIDAREAREAMDFVLDEWNEDPRRHWRALVEKQRERVLDYETRQAEKSAEKVARYKAGDWS